MREDPGGVPLLYYIVCSARMREDRCATAHYNSKRRLLARTSGSTTPSSQTVSTAVVALRDTLALRYKQASLTDTPASKTSTDPSRRIRGRRRRSILSTPVRPAPSWCRSGELTDLPSWNQQ